MHNFKELIVWKKSKDFVKLLFEQFQTFDTKYSVLYKQIMRSALSIPSNIAEGAGRNSNKQFNQFLNIAYGSSCELETQLIIAHELGILEELNFKEISKLLEEIQKMLYKLIKSIG